MIGRFRFDFGEEEAVAALGDDLAWACDVEVAERFLNAVYGPDPLQSPSHGRPGFARFEEAREALGGEVLEKFPEPRASGLVF